MIKSTTFALAVTLISSSAFADTQKANYGNSGSPQETTGVLGGAALGGLAGGPPGAVIGAAIGGLIGDGFRARKEVNELQTDVIALRVETDRMRNQAQSLQRQHQLALQQLDKLKSTQANVIPAYLPGNNAQPHFDNTALAVHFRSGSSAIESHYEEYLQSLVKLAKQMPSAAIEITGYTDRNGDAEQNLRLSRQRTDAVKDFFNRMGVQNSSITTVAYGESKPLQPSQSLETDFFDRRVTVRLRDTSQQMLSQSEDGQ